MPRRPMSLFCLPPRLATPPQVRSAMVDRGEIAARWGDRVQTLALEILEEVVVGMLREGVCPDCGQSSLLRGPLRWMKQECACGSCGAAFLDRLFHYDRVKSPSSAPTLFGMGSVRPPHLLASARDYLPDSVLVLLPEPEFYPEAQPVPTLTD